MQVVGMVGELLGGAAELSYKQARMWAGGGELRAALIAHAALCAAGNIGGCGAAVNLL